MSDGHGDQPLSEESPDYIRQTKKIETTEDFLRWVKASTFGVHIDDIIYPTIALAGEVGEFSDVVKKAMRDSKTTMIAFAFSPGDRSMPVVSISDEETRAKAIDELSDVIHYIARCCLALNVTFDEVIHHNVDKIRSRFAEGGKWHDAHSGQ